MRKNSPQPSKRDELATEQETAEQKRCLADQNAGEFEVVGNPFTKEPYGIGLAKDDTEFRDFINDVLEESYEDGTWAEAWEATAGSVLETPEPPAVDRY